MYKEKYHNSIKKWVYSKFDELHVISNCEENLYFGYKNDSFFVIRIYKATGNVYYTHRLRDLVSKKLALNIIDFEILLRRWIESKCEIKINKIIDLLF
jgi:hypothetical protein